MGQSLSGSSAKRRPRALHPATCWTARRNSVQLPKYTTPRQRTIPVDQEPYFPGDEATGANTAFGSRCRRPGDAPSAPAVGGHISSTPLATLWVGLNHFFLGKDRGGGDHVFGPPSPATRCPFPGRPASRMDSGFRPGRYPRARPALPTRTCASSTTSGVPRTPFD